MWIVVHVLCKRTDFYRIERSEKDGQNYIRGVKDPNMFMNRTACKAQYKPKPKSKQLVKPGMYILVI